MKEHGGLKSYLQLHYKCITHEKYKMDICSFVHQCNTFTSYIPLIVDMLLESIL
jgi:hypothetical protein